ncbi:MAG: 50S ribosomal protein L10 [Planctomycetes bacterium]|nr:50S ribosomal protein L10 [Planctomycetota bacterium]
MSKVVKQMMMSSIQGALGECREVLILDFSRMDGMAVNQLRNTLRKKQITLLGVKNAVARRALSEIGLTGAADVLTGACTLAFGSDDIVALSKEMSEWCEKIKTIEIRGGAIGSTPLKAADVETLSKSPGRRELLSQIAGLILSPGAQLAAAIKGPGGKIAGQVKTLADKAS